MDEGRVQLDEIWRSVAGGKVETQLGLNMFGGTKKCNRDIIRKRLGMAVKKIVKECRKAQDAVFGVYRSRMQAWICTQCPICHWLYT